MGPDLRHGEPAAEPGTVWNVAPTQDAAVVRRHPDTGARHLDLLKWGLLPYRAQEPTKAQRPINARSETAAKSGMFKGALARRHCLVPADAFYEWKVVEGGKALRDRGPALPVRLQPRPGATRLIVGQPPGRTFP